ncbi:diguanylate cyclase domain-containing protein [Sulfuricurvum sp.]|uniref:diguanylate cyclase domain-containing protein n=1 Tax=Sulfuricurvum sp. TaxID=2025608 RepID=UPI002E36097F|nr:diguanylate cyclase [Sulfuricurvum sp.]HEX5330237.1 diguanylate cyclase [Sulfuricurvum sp.]
MSIQKIAKYAKHFDVLVIHESSDVPPYRESIETVFRSSTFISIDAEQTPTPLQCHLLIVCGSYPFLKNPALRTLLSRVQSLESIIFTPDFSNINVYKIALSFRASNVIAVPQSEDEFANAMMGIFSSLVKKHNEHILSNYDRMISEFSDNLFWIHKDKKVLYANEALKQKFGIKSLGELDYYFEDKEIAPLINASGISQKIITKKDYKGEEKAYFATNQLLKDREYLVSMIPLSAPIEDQDKQLYNRMSFIELLKDAFVVHKRENEPIPVIVMYIENTDKIIEMRGEDIYNNVCKEILKLVRTTFKNDIKIAQWHKDIFTLLATDISLDALKRSLEKFHQSLGIEISIDGASPLIDSFIIDMHGVELNKAIGIIDHINQKQLLSRDLTHLVHFEISASPQEIDEVQHAIHYLEKMIMTNTAVKLLNFYKGIRISTSAKLVKISDDMVYISIEKIQGYAMKLEQSVVIQGPNIPFDILANVQIVDVAKKIAVLTKFEPLEASGNNRQYIRIQSDHRMHVTIGTGRSVLSGTILDISIKSIACKISSSKKAPLILHSRVNLQFNLPMERFEDGMVSMVIAGKIQYIQEGDEFTKVVVELDLMEPYEGYLIEYIYARQQALVNEIKTIANKL